MISKRKTKSMILTVLAVTVFLLAGRAPLGRALAAPIEPLFRDVSVHDPAVLQADGYFYIFGSHLAAAKSTDLMQWDLIAEGATPANRLFANVREDLKETFAWSQSNSLWAPDVIRLKDGRYAMYYDACKGDSPRSALGLAVSDRVEGPYHDLGVLLKSGMWGQPGEDGTVYNARIHPNVVDPCVFYDRDGRLWMAYGSYSGGIFILKMDPESGKPLPGQGYGKRLMGGNHSRIEAPYIVYHPKSRFYYLYVSFGGLDAQGGYNIRVARSRTPDGPYLDAVGHDMTTVKANPEQPLFDDASIAPHGVKLMGNFRLSPTSPGVLGYVSPGHNSVYLDPHTNRQFLIFHTRFPETGNLHQVRVHPVLMNERDWPVVAPLRYAGEAPGKISTAEISGTYQTVNHGQSISAEITPSLPVILQKNGQVTGALSGTWRKHGDARVTLVIGGEAFRGVILRQWDPRTKQWTVTFTTLTDRGVALWGIREGNVPDLPKRKMGA